MFDSRAICPLPYPEPVIADVGVLRFGLPNVDDWLKGGLKRDGLHEFYPSDDKDKTTAMAFALLFALRACGAAMPLVWLRIRGSNHQHPYGPGLVELGLDANAMLLMQLPDLNGLLKAAVDCARHGGAGAVIMEIDGRAVPFDLTASRRLTLAAERSGTLVLVVRNHIEPMPSAAHTRWKITSAPSMPLAANAPGHPVFGLSLLRQRGGRDGLQVQLEWDREHAVFREARAGQTPLSGDSSAFSAGGTADRRTSRAA